MARTPSGFPMSLPPRTLGGWGAQPLIPHLHAKNCLCETVGSEAI